MSRDIEADVGGDPFASLFTKRSRKLSNKICIDCSIASDAPPLAILKRSHDDICDRFVNVGQERRFNLARCQAKGTSFDFFRHPMERIALRQQSSLLMRDVRGRLT